MKEDLRVNILQTEIAWHKVEQNLAAAEQLLHNAPQADLAVLPEMFATGFVIDRRQKADGDQTILNWMRQLAARENTAIAGSAAIVENGLRHNRLYLVTPDGETQSYDKRHLFPGSPEPAFFQKGARLPIFQYKGWKICPQVCYDLRFPLWCRNALLDGEFKYDILLNVANWPASRADAWNTLLRARALENQCYVIACNCVGNDSQNTHYQGDSQIIRPDGSILARSTNDQPQCVSATLSLPDLQSLREKFPVANDWD